MIKLHTFSVFCAVISYYRALRFRSNFQLHCRGFTKQQKQNASNILLVFDRSSIQTHINSKNWYRTKNVVVYIELTQSVRVATFFTSGIFHIFDAVTVLLSKICSFDSMTSHG